MNMDVLGGFDLLLEVLETEKNRMASTISPLIIAGRTSEGSNVLAMIVRIEGVIRQVQGLREECRHLSTEKPGLADGAAPTSSSRSTGLAKAVSGNKRRSRRSTSGTARRLGNTTPQMAYKDPLILALGSLGGSSQASRVVEAVGLMMKDRFTEDDKGQLDSGPVRWETNVRWAREYLKIEGLLKPDSPTGIWELAEEGWRRYRDLQGEPLVLKPTRSADIPVK
ncbi:MAG: winged helix-turn-helix domain-containing protein [Chloroflexota bacterium]